MANGDMIISRAKDRGGGGTTQPPWTDAQKKERKKEMNEN